MRKAFAVIVAAAAVAVALPGAALAGTAAVADCAGPHAVNVATCPDVSVDNILNNLDASGLLGVVNIL